MDWFDIPHDKVRWRGAIVNAVMTLSSIKCREILGQLRFSQLLKKDSAEWSGVSLTEFAKWLTLK
jgi:hypothetical protein